DVGVEVDELDDKLYMFRFEHQLDVCMVMDKRPWHLNGVPLITHELQPGEFPDQALGNFVGHYLKYDAKNAIAYPDAYMRIRVLLDVRAPL
ncbi:hypothetical protein LINGRAHAP2_LOCUS32890, partial [Linum grandiflorum]